MSGLTPAELKNLMGGAGSTQLDDPSLQLLLDAAWEAITARRGDAVGSITLTNRGGSKLIFLPRPALSITSIAEGPVPVALQAGQYSLWPNQTVIERLSTFGGYRFGSPSVIVFVPVDDTAERKRVQLALVKLDLAYSGYGSVATQNESRQSVNYLTERAEILESFAVTTERR